MWRDAAVAVPADCALWPHLQVGVYRQVCVNSILKFDTIIILFYNKISNVWGARAWDIHNRKSSKKIMNNL